MNMHLAHAVNEAFERMTRLYGREFIAKFEADIDAVKTQWVRELAPIPDVLDAVAWALKNLPERPPNAITFRNLCRQAPSRHQAAMLFDTSPVRGPTPEELATLAEVRARIVNGEGFGRRPGREWAFELIAKHERGEDVSGYALRCAREVAAMRAAPVDVPRETTATTARASQAAPWDDFYDEEQRP